MLTLNDIQKNAVREALDRNDWCFHRAGAELGTSAQRVHQMAQRYRLIVQRTVRVKKWVKARAA